MPQPRTLSGAAAHTPPSCVRLERRRSDFQRDARVTPFTGSCCCCCCCLHWIGAVAGGVVGARLGWQSAEKLDTPLPDTARQALRKGVQMGVGLSVLTVVGAVVLALLWAKSSVVRPVEYFVGALALVPSLAFVPMGVSMIVAAHRFRGRMLRAFLGDIKKLPAKDGSEKSMSLYREKLTAPPKTRDPLLQFSVFCPHCWTDVVESMHLPTCPECAGPLDHPVIHGPDYGVRIAWRSALISFGLATAGTLVSYLFMWLLAFLL